MPHVAPPRRRSARLDWLGPAAIALLTLLAFSNSLANGWLSNWDDNIYVTGSPAVRDLTPRGIARIFTSYQTDNYHPLTTLSYALQYRLGGLTASRFHALNLLLHVANTLLVFHFVRALRAATPVALIVSALFGVHPMHVESVSWISARKDLLYAMFYLAALIAYVRYATHAPRRKSAYALSLALFVCSLLAKSAAVTLPLVLLLIDWYVGRRRGRITGLLLEKLPFFALSLAIGLVALDSQGRFDIAPHFPWYDRIFLVSYALVFYVVKLFVPVRLSALYLYPVKHGPFLPLAYYLACAAVLALALLIQRAGRYRRDLLFGVGFFLVTIGLVLQILPVGRALVADRYTYLSYVGLLFSLAQVYGGILERVAGRARTWRVWLVAPVVLFVLLCAVATHRRNSVWRDSVTLTTDAIAKQGSGEQAAFLYASRGSAQAMAGNHAAALRDFEEAVRLQPRYPEVLLNLGVLRQDQQAYGEALALFGRAIAADPGYVNAYLNRGSLRLQLGDRRAIEDFDSAVRHAPADPDVWAARGMARHVGGDFAAACADWQRSSQLGHGPSAALLAEHCR